MTDPRDALRRLAGDDPELAARLALQMLPAVAARVDGVRFALDVDGLGTWVVGDGRVSSGNGDDPVDFRVVTDPGGFARLSSGASPLPLLLSGRVRIRGRRRRALKLRALADGPPPTLGEALAAGAELDVDAAFRALPYMVDPQWTRGHEFTVAYEVEGAGRWVVHARDGAPLAVTTGPEPADATLRLEMDVYRRLAAGDVSPDAAMRTQLVAVEGALYPVTLTGRWIERSQGRDDAELERETAQRRLQQQRAGSWGGSRNGRALPAAGARGEEGPGDRRTDLLDYGELYALWERQNWKAHEIDFSVDRRHWLASPAEAQSNMIWSLGAFYVGEERVTADLAPLLTAAPSGEVEVFLATQLVDEARHAAFFDRFGAEVMALAPGDLRGRLLELQSRMLAPWFDIFDAGLREIVNRVKERPDDRALFVEAITTYHLVIEGVLAMTGQRFILQYFEDHGMYPGFQQGFSLVERDEHRHIAFGVRFLKDAVEAEPRYGEIIRRRVEELVPRAIVVFKPPHADDAREWVSYGYDSRQIYGYAYRKLKRRMTLLGLDVAPPEELMPGPIATPEEARAAGVPV
jgi:ribonucleoside-diphosphate reductase beta chain